MMRHGVLSGSNPFQPTGRPWCRWCRDETEVDVQSYHAEGKFMYREICRRCKRIVNAGVYSNVPLIGGERQWAGLA